MNYKTTLLICTLMISAALYARKQTTKSSAASTALQQTQLAHAKQVIASTPGTVIVFFTKNAGSCRYCDYLSPAFAQLQKNNPECTFLILNADAAPIFRSAYGLSSFPTVIYFNHGVEQFRHGSNNCTITVAQMQEMLSSLSATQTIS